MGAIEKAKGKISTLDFFCIGFGAIVGVGWAVFVNRWIANAGGPIPSASGYLMCLVLLVPVALCYAELVPMMPVAGGGAAFAYQAFGQNTAFVSGWAAFGGFVLILPWEAIMVSSILAYAFPTLIMAGAPLYEIMGEQVYFPQIIVGTIVAIMLFYINYKGTKGAASYQKIITIIFLVLGTSTIVAAITHFNPDNLMPLYENVRNKAHTNAFGGILSVMMMAPFFLAGFETIPQAVEDAAGKVSAVGKTVVLAVAAACLYYAFAIIGFGGAMPWREFWFDLSFPAAGNLFPYIMGGGAGVFWYGVIIFVAVISLTTTWNGFMIASPRLLMGMGRANMIPKIFAQQHPKTKVPMAGLIASFVISLTGPFLGLGLSDAITEVCAAGFVLSWALTSSSAFRLRITEPDTPRPYKMPGGIAMAGFAALMMWIFFISFFVPGSPTFLGGFVIKFFLGWMAVGFVLYLAAGPQRNAIPKEQRAAELFRRNK